MVFWSGYFRPVRCHATVRVFLRRARCRVCRSSAVLLPSFLLAKRLDAVEVIGPVIEAVVAGAGTRRSARDAGLVHETARSWWRRHRTRALLAGSLLALAGMGLSTPASVGLYALAPHDEPDRWRTAALRSCGNWLAPLCRQHHLTPAQGPRGGVG